jgi:Uma2 family endonuclease
MSTISSPTKGPVSADSLWSIPPRTADRPQPYRFTVEQYEKMTELGIFTERDKVELIDGLVVSQMTKNRPHVVATQLAREALSGLIPAGWHLGKEDPIRIPGRSEPEPDVTVIRGEPRDYIDKAPGVTDIALLVEVAETSLDFDSTDKLRVYALAGVPVYWIVNLVDRRLEVYSEPDSGGYRARQVLTAGQHVSVVIAGTEIGRIAVADLLP